MKKILLSLIVFFLTVNLSYSQVATLWEKSAALGTNTNWNTGSVTRGLAYGMVGANSRLFVVTRSADYSGKQIFIFNASTGDSVGFLDTTGISGGTFPLNDVEISSDGKIFICNLSTNTSTDTFRVYKYDSESSAPVPVIKYLGTTAYRLGDKFTVTGSTADNSIIIWAASSAVAGDVVKFTTTDNGVTFTPQVVSIGVFNGSASVGPMPNGDFYYNAQGLNAQKFDAAGTLIGTIPPAVVGTGSNAIRFMNSLVGDEYFVTVAFGAGLEHGRIVKVPDGVSANAVLYTNTPTLGTNSAGGLGDISVQPISPWVFNVYVLSTNNGFGAYQVTLALPPLSGDYFIGDVGTGPGGSDPDFLSLRDAFDVMNDAAFTGDCNFFITSDIFEPFTPAVGYGLGLAINPDPFTVTLKPYTGVQPVITLAYPTDGTSGPSGALIIGVPSKGNIAWDSLKTTKNIIIDGSNTIGGTSRDLTIQTTTTAHRNAIPLVIVGDVSNLIIKNTNVYYKPQTVSTSGNLFIGAVMIRSRNYLGVDWVPHDLLFENNHLNGNFDGVAQSSQGYGCYQTGTPLPSSYPYNITLRDNKIEGKRRGISLYRAGSHDIFGNEIVLNQNIAANTTNEAIYAADVDTGSVINIYKNIISKVSSISSGTSVGNTAISIETYGMYNIYNNMIYGFNLEATNPAAYLRGVKNSSASATLYLYHNSFYMDNLADIGSGSVPYYGMYFTDGINDLKNNIVYNAETDFSTFCIYREGTNGTVTSDYNDLYPVSSTNGNVGFWNNAPAQTLSAWQTASGQDANSISKEIFFISPTDLHLTGSSNGDVDLAGTPGTGITDDIDGNLRSTTFPYMGCDEASNPIPVELTSFSASVIDNDVHLKWTTATEINNHGFEIQRGREEKFITIGFVKGNGTTTEINSYSFVNTKVETGKYSYRLKQIDLNGVFSYSKVIEIDVASPLTFTLSQNYPNPFNPSTTISYEIAKPVNVSLIIYNMLGEQVQVLINNQLNEPGVHSVNFDASNIASGTYIYRLQAGDFVDTKKMMLTK